MDSSLADHKDLTIPCIQVHPKVEFYLYPPLVSWEGRHAQIVLLFPIISVTMPHLIIIKVA